MCNHTGFWWTSSPAAEVNDRYFIQQSVFDSLKNSATFIPLTLCLRDPVYPIAAHRHVRAHPSSDTVTEVQVVVVIDQDSTIFYP